MSGNHRSMVCILAPAAFRAGGIERLTWNVRAALAAAVGQDNVFLGLLVGPGNPDELRGRPEVTYAAGYPLSPGKKLRFSGWALSFARHHRDVSLLCMHPNQAQLAWAAHRLFGTRYAVWAHGFEVWGRMQPLPRAALRAARLVLCSSEFTRRQVIDYQGVPEERVIAIHPPVTGALLQRAERVTRSAGDAPPVIASVGRVARGYEYKGFDTLIRTLPATAARVPAARLRIVGGGDGIMDLRRLADAVGVADHVEFLGALADEAMWDVLASARVFALPSRASLDRKHGEGFGIVYVEAAAFGLPVVGSRAGGAVEALISGRTGRAVDPQDDNEVTDALIEYLSSPERASEDGRRGREWARATFDPRLFAAKLVDALADSGLLPRSSHS